MSNVLLVTPTNEINAHLQNWTAPHMGVWRIAGYLESRGHSCQVWDTILGAEPPEGRWDIIGFSVTHDTLPDDIRLMKKMAAEHPLALMVAGGPEASTNYQQLFEQVSRLFWVIIGEGELAMLALADGRAGKPGCRELMVPNSIGRTYGTMTEEHLTDFNMLMPFKRMGYERHWAIVKDLHPDVMDRELYCVRLNTSTFCDRSCKFCSITHIHRMASGYTCKPITMPGADTKELVRKVVAELPQTRMVYFHDDSFTTYVEKAVEFFDHPPAMDYHVQARTDEVDYDLLKHMAQGGCIRISFGVENCSPHVLKDIGKGTRIDQVEHTIARCKSLGIDPYLLIILFCPTCTMRDMVINYRKLSEWLEEGLSLSIMSYIRPYHGSYYLNKGMHEIRWQKRRGIKQPWVLLPDDPDVRTMWEEFEKRVEVAQSDLRHPFKGNVSPLMVSILGDLLKARGVI